MKRKCYYSGKRGVAIDVKTGREDPVAQVILGGFNKSDLVLESGEMVRIAYRDPNAAAARYRAHEQRWTTILADPSTFTPL